LYCKEWNIFDSTKKTLTKAQQYYLLINIKVCCDIIIIFTPLLRIVATVSGKASLGNGSQQDMEEFFTTVMLELEKEVTDDDGLFLPF
jgi:hypothetical protein